MLFRSRAGTVGAGAAVFLGAGAFPAAFFLPFLLCKDGAALGGGPAFAGGRGADAAGAAIAGPAAFPILIGPLVAVAVEVGRWELVLQGDEKLTMKPAKARRPRSAAVAPFFIWHFPFCIGSARSGGEAIDQHDVCDGPEHQAVGDGDVDE